MSGELILVIGIIIFLFIYNQVINTGDTFNSNNPYLKFLKEN